MLSATAPQVQVVMWTEELKLLNKIFMHPENQQKKSILGKPYDGEARAKGPSTPHTMSLINVLCTRPGGRYPRGVARGHSGPRGGKTARNPEVSHVVLRHTRKGVT